MLNLFKRKHRSPGNIKELLKNIKENEPEFYKYLCIFKNKLIYNNKLVILTDINKLVSAEHFRLVIPKIKPSQYWFLNSISMILLTPTLTVRVSTSYEEDNDVVTSSFIYGYHSAAITKEVTTKIIDKRYDYNNTEFCEEYDGDLYFRISINDILELE